MFVLAAFLALPSSNGTDIRTCNVTLKLNKPCSFQECQAPCIQNYKGTGICIGEKQQYLQLRLQLLSLYISMAEDLGPS
ncbi:hypothetical protein F2Q70_00034379 [Brassica cretica]|uniref:Secreted protein n=2 Tax=Brassica cretica TaxID=69181 RepID=A0A8S9GAP2_BRACR|nr:hypothetical protein F2Q68_00029283 [Brassica cretica]KAF2586534.1 hypothetical protein F2Q70_00034379 [Brassica cretica]KAF3529071.1 hypothetical protein DY000_02037101 [Brassica cretica]